MAHLRSMGIDISEPGPPSRPRSPLPPPPPPGAPGMPAPPEPPGEPGADMIERSYHYQLQMTDEERKEFDEEMRKVDEEIRKIRVITIPDLGELDDMLKNHINISIDGDMLSAEDQEQFNKEMEKLKEELKVLNEKLKDLKIEIRDHSFDFDDKEGSFRVIDDDHNYVYIYKTTKEKDKDKGKSKVKGKGVNAATFHVYPNPGDGVINLELNLDDNSPVQITVTDANGKVVYEERQEKFKGKLEKKIDISDKGKGIYMITVTQGDNRMQTKVVVK
jgi:hypothetical protein